MYVDLWNSVLDLPHDRLVVLAGESGMDSALQADLGRAARPSLAGTTRDLAVRHEIRGAAQIRRELALRERAKATAEVADVRVLDVPGADVRHVVSTDFA